MTIPSDEPARPPVDGNGRHLIEKIAWPAMGYLSLIMVLTVGLVVFAVISPNTEVAQIIGQSRGLRGAMGVVVIAPIIAVLALLDKLTPAAVAALIGIAGISGAGGGGP
jgi:hypothetical protein